MKLNIILVVISFSVFFESYGQQHNIGGQVGITYGQMTAITTIGEEEESRLDGVGDAEPLPGIAAGVFGTYYLTPKVFLRAEVGYELLRFKSDTFTPGTGEIHHLKGGGLIGMDILKFWNVVAGGELVSRSNDFKGDNPLHELNGLDIEGAYWQAIFETNFIFKNEMQLGFRTALPRIASLTRRFLSLSGNRLLVEQIRAFQLKLSVPIIKSEY